MTIKPYNTEAVDLAWVRLKRTGSVAAMVAGSVLLLGAFSFVVSLLQPGTAASWYSLTQDNWLIVLAKLHAGFEDIRPDRLFGLYPLDVVILLLNSLVYLGLFAALRKTSRVWTIIATAMAFLGIVLLIVTQTAGRSAVMGAGLIISIVMLGSRAFAKIIAWAGILASALLLFGDISLSSNHSIPIAILTAIGYLLLTVWYFWVGRSLSVPDSQVSR